MTWLDVVADTAFGPEFKDEFDFTLEFEHTILSIGPAALLLLGIPILSFRFRKRPAIISSGWLLWLKLIAATALLAVDIANIVLWCQSGERRTSFAIASAATTLVAAAALLPTLYLEHRHTLRSSSFIAIWLIATIFCDATRARSLFLRDLRQVAILATVSAVIKGIIFCLEEVPKTRWIMDEETKKNTGKQAASGFVSRSLFLWINGMFYAGSKGVLKLEDLDSLGPSLASDHLLEHFHKFWTSGSGFVSGYLPTACFRANLGPFLSAGPPRFFLSIFTVSQPILLKAVVKFVQDEGRLPGHRDGLIVAATLIYAGLAMAKATYTQRTVRFGTRLRGMLVAEISNKSLRLKQAEALKAKSISLTNTDIPILLVCMTSFHDMWANSLELGVNLYVLFTNAGAATSLVIFPAIMSGITGYFVGNRMPPARKLWNESVTTRVSRTSNVLSQIKAIKMTGLEGVMTNYIQKLREKEMDLSKKSRFWLMILYFIGTVSDNITAPLVLAGGIFWTTLGENFTPANVFTTLAVVALIGLGLDALITDYFLIQSGKACIERIQDYLAQEEIEDSRQSTLQSELTEKATNEECVEELTEKPMANGERSSNCMVELRDASITPQGADEAVMTAVTFEVNRKELAMMIGPTGCGKSTLLQTILGETNVSAKSLYVGPGQIAYCGQTAWIWNETIQANIIGESPVNMAWYEEVVEALLLKKDFGRLAKGDQTKAGSNGGNLSGGQKHRVVREILIAMARALYAQAPFFLMDDNFSSLDRQTAAEIFIRLFGKDGLVRGSGTTVVMATHSIQFLQFADRIIAIDEEGKVTTETDVENVKLNDQIQKIISEIEKNSRHAEDDHEASDEEHRDQIDEEDSDAKAGAIARQKRDMTIYGFFFKTFRFLHVFGGLGLTFLTALLEVFSDGYMRIWMELQPYNRLFYIGYASMTGLAGFSIGAAVSVWFFRSVPYSALVVHRMLLDLVMRAKLSFLTSRDHGGLLNRFSLDMSLITQTLAISYWRTTYHFCRLLIRIVLIIAIIKYTIVLLPVLFVMIYFIQNYYLRTSRQLRYMNLETTAPLVSQFTESATGLHHIRAFGWQEKRQERTLKLLDICQKPHYGLLMAERWLALAMDGISTIIGILLVTIAVWLAYATTAAGVGLSLVSLVSLSFDTSHFVEDWMLLETSIGALSRLREFIQTAPLEVDCDKPAELPSNWPNKGEVVMTEVVASYDSKSAAPPVLNNVSIRIDAGQKVGIIGRTGSGKSSMLLTLLGFLDYTGTITIDGVDISRVPRDILRSAITTISQDNIELEGTVRHNLCPWEENMSDKEANTASISAIRVLRQLGLLEIVKQRGGLDADMLTLGLSHGQKQLMCIARSCLRNVSKGTKIIVLDEATSNLDHTTETMVLTMLHKLFEDCTVIMIAHRTETLNKVDMIVEVADGKIASIKDTEARQDEIGPQEEVVDARDDDSEIEVVLKMSSEVVLEVHKTTDQARQEVAGRANRLIEHIREESRLKAQAKAQSAERQGQGQ